MNGSQRPTNVQLEIIAHVANGLREEEIAVKTHRSKSSVQKTIAASRRLMGATNNAHLVGLVIARGFIFWSHVNDEHIINEPCVRCGNYLGNGGHGPGFCQDRRQD